MTDFVSLHNHTDFSILDSLITPKELFNRAKELGQKAIAITDHGSLASAWDALKASKASGVKLIIGCEMYFLNDAKKTDERFRHIILLAKNAVGYKNLLLLNKRGFDNSAIFAKRIYPIIDWSALKEYSEGLICLTSCSNGILAQLLMNKRFDEAEDQLNKLVNIFGDDLGLEVQANTLKRGSNVHNDVIEQVFVNAQIIKLAKKYNVRCVATTNSHYVNKADSETHDVLLAIGSHQPIHSNFRLKYDCPEFYLKSGDEVKSFFERNYGDFADELCANTVYFADKCEEPAWIDPKFSNPSGKELPTFPTKDELDYFIFVKWKADQTEDLQKQDEDKLYLRFKCEESLKNKLNKIDPDKIAEYKARIEEELEVFEFHGFSSYMLIVADYINWARKNEIRIGDGRGSVGGSLVAYILGIHQADPIKYGLIFARFHNKEKSSFPDIDTDFAPSGREKVQDYLRAKYGADHVAHVSNVNTITPKVYVRDVCRACELGGSKDAAVKLGTDIADCIPKDIHSIDDALERVPMFAEYAKKYPELSKYKAICGKYRAWSTHAGGIIISARPLPGLIPLRKDKEGQWAIEYDKEKAEENGLVKMDTLGLSTLDLIDQTYRLIKEAGKEAPPDPPDYDEYDQTTYDLISKGDTFCVFQLGTSSGTIDLCRRIKPKSVNDISYINSLARPSAREMRSDFIATKDGKKPFALLHPTLGRAFNNTFGFGLYEESLMYLAQDVAGWTLHGADNLRKLTKEKGKNPKKVQQWRKEFIEGAVSRNVNEEIAKRIWDEVVDKFQGYGFNMSHSILYSMSSYRTAYLKAHYPLEFLLANLMAEVKSNSPDAKNNIAKIKKEIKSQKVKIVPPDINKSSLTYTIDKDNKLITGLDALKFVSDEAIKDIILKRPFRNFFDFMSRVETKKVRANTIQALAASGCLDSFNIPRKHIFLYVSDYRKKLQVWLKRHDPSKEEFSYPWPNDPEWTLPELYALENNYLGDSFVCGKLQAYGDFFKTSHITLDKIKRAPDKSSAKSVRVEVKDMFEFKIKKNDSKYYGQSMIKATVEDVNGAQCGMTIFPKGLAQANSRIKDLTNGKHIFGIGCALHFAGTVNVYEDEVGIILEDLFSFQPCPQPPADLKAKKINLKLLKKEKVEETSGEMETEDILFEEIEDMLINEGLLDIDVDYDGDI